MDKQEKEIEVNGLTWSQFQSEVHNKVKYYFSIEIGKKKLRTIKSMWRGGHSVADVVSYILLSD